MSLVFPVWDSSVPTVVICAAGDTGIATYAATILASALLIRKVTTLGSMAGEHELTIEKEDFARQGP